MGVVLGFDRDRHPVVRALSVWLPVSSPWRSRSPPTRWCAGCGEAGFAIPVIPLLIGGQAMIWLTWPFGTAGALGAFGGTVVVCLIWRLVGQAVSTSSRSTTCATSRRRSSWRPGFRCSARFGALLIYPGRRRASGVHGDRAVVFADIGGYAPGCCSASTRWCPRSARRNRGRVSPVRCCSASPPPCWP